MPSFSRSLELGLHTALGFANERSQEFATLEHLLLALLDDNDASAVMRACNVDMDRLRADLTEYIDTELTNLLLAGFDPVAIDAYASDGGPETPALFRRSPAHPGKTSESVRRVRGRR